MGGSVIGLFGDFGDGWYKTGYEIKSSNKNATHWVHEKNPYAFGLEGDRASGLWDHLKVGDVVRDMDYLGVEKVPKFNGQKYLKSTKFQINGFGMEIQSINGSVLKRGKSDKNLDLRDIRQIASSGKDFSKRGELKIQVQVKRVPAMFEGKSDNTKGMSFRSEDLCTVAYKTLNKEKDGTYDLFYVFNSIKVGDKYVRGGVLRGNRVGNGKTTCKRIAQLYQEKWVKGSEEERLIYLHQKFVDSRKGEAVYAIGPQNNLYLWETGDGYEAIALSGIIWSGFNYTGGNSEHGQCKDVPVNKKDDCYRSKGSAKVKEHIGWQGFQGKDFETVSVKSMPADNEIFQNEDNQWKLYDNSCEGKRICIGLPWEKNVNFSQIVQRK